MELNLEAVNAVRKANGLELLTELPPKKETPIIPINDVKTAEQLAEEKRIEEEKKKKPKSVETPTTLELKEDVILEYLRKQGINANSLEDLKPKEDLAAAAEKREADKLSWALSKGKLTKKEHEAYVIDANDPQNFVFRHYYNQAKQADSELTDEEIQAEFAGKFGLDTEPGTRKHKQGQQDLAILSEQMLRMRHGKLFGIDNEYSNYENTSKQQQEFNRKVLAGAESFKNDVSSAINELKKIPISISDTEEYEVDAVEESLTQIQNEMLDTDFLARKVTQGYTKEELKEIAFSRYLRLNFPTITKAAINQALLKQQKGTRGIIPKGPVVTSETYTLTPEQQKMVEIIQANKPQTAAV